MLALVAAALLSPDRAAANCFPNSPGSGDTVTCNTNSPNPETTPVTAQPRASRVTVRVLPGAQLSVNGTAITLTDGREIVNNGGGSIRGQTGIDATGAVRITNSGQITGTAGPAIVLNGSGVGEIDNFGTIGGSGSSVITLDTNRGDTVTLDNASGGSINGNVAGSGHGNISIVQEGNFNGGVTISGDGETTIVSAAGHNFAAPVSISGAINIIDNGGTYNAGLTLAATLTNTVLNEQNAVIDQLLSVTGSSNVITNIGTLNNGLSVATNGFNTISNRAGASIDQSFTVNGNGFDTIFNFGTINATMNVTGSGVLINSGTISGGATAIAFTAGTTAATGTSSPFTLELLPGFVINGAVLGTGRDELELGGPGSAAFNVSAIGPSQQFQGFANFQKVDPSTWSLAGNGAQNWDIRGGTLVGDTNSLQGNNLDNDAELVFNQNFAGTYAGAISGHGDVTVSGGGTLTFTGPNTYSGSTTISGSTLSLGAGGTTGSVSGDIVDRGTLIFNRSDTLVLSDDLSGGGTILQTGTGRTVLHGFSPFAGNTIVNAGTLEVDGAIAHSAITVNAGATLSGNGAVGPTTVASGGTLQPGDDPGAIVVQGDLTFQNGANYSVEVAPRIASAVFVTGNTSVAGTLTAVAFGGPFTRNAIYPVVISVRPLSGTFNLATSGDFGGTSLSLLYSTHDVFLNLSTSPAGPPVWSTNPTTSDWNTGSNWQAGSVPLATDIAHFGASSVTTVDITAPNTEISGLAFDSSAPIYTFRITGSGTTPASLIISGSGIASFSSTPSNAANFLVSGTASAPGTLLFENSATPDQTNITSGAFGTTSFTGPGTAANARLIANSGGTFDFSGAGATNFTIGSVEGAGTFALGSADLTEGGNGLDTQVGGTITDGGTAGGTGASLTKIGNGTLTLTGDNSYTGPTSIAGGTLQLGAGGTTGSVAGAIIDNQTLVIDHSGLFHMASGISGGGNLVLAGSGITELSGNNTYTGPTSVQSGTLAVHGAVDGTSNIAVGNGGSATLLIDHGGSLSDGTGLLGSLAGTSGSAIVAGTGSHWSNSGSLVIGGGGDGSLVIANGASVVANSVIIAQTASSTGTLSIGGAASAAPLAAGTLDPPAVTFGAGAGSLVFNHVNSAFFFDAPLSGSGTIRQDGPGTTILTADSSAFTGSTAVNAGTLAVRGVLGAPSSTLAVNSGGTLTGTGSVGAVTVNSGGSLSGEQGETLTLASLVLGSGSNLDLALGSQGTTAFFAVTGALTLGGTLNVGDLGGFGGGITRLIDYAGPLTDNGLAIGTVPPGTSASDLVIQTSVAGQVNLINSRGVTVRFWDGKGPPNDGIVQGASDIWNATAANWTTSDGTINGAWSTDFAIFAATPGTVFVDASQGALSATGLQFAVDGYRLIGDPLVLAGQAAVIRVGDGLLAGANDTATIEDALSGSATLVKTDQGTLVLGGVNTYSGGTLILGGVISISSDSNLGAASGGLSIDQGTLETTADIVSARSVTTLQAAALSPNSGTTLVLDGALSGPGSLTMSGPGTLVLAGDDTAQGGTTIADGTLVLGNGGTTGTLAGDVMDNAAFAVNRSDSVVLAGTISGSGSFTQTGPGTTILTGDSDYSGGTTIADGTLQLGNGGTSGSISGAIQDNATLAIDRSDVFELTNTISGSGALAQLGSGTTVVTGENTYSGGTVISAGVLQIGDGGTSGSITGDVTDNAALVFARSDVVSFAGAISGTGSLTQSGPGRLILMGTNTYLSGTTIAAGILQLGDGGASGSILGAITDNGVLAVARSDTFTLANAISGTGGFLQAGPGTTVLSGTSTYTGATAVESGLLTVHGAVSATSDVSVADFGAASLVIGNGGQLVTDSAIIGRLPGSSGNGLVAGANSLWSIAGSLEIGKQGTGSLTVTGGGEVTAGAVEIAGAASSLGTLNIGAPAGLAPRAAGIIDPPTITFGFGAGTLNFNHANPAYVFDTPVAGVGTITQNGPGTTIVTGDSSAFAGLSLINAGTLEVLGTLGGPSSAASVETGGTLTGTGTVGGTTIINNGGTLSGVEGQTLAVNALTLASGATLDVTLGIPGTITLFHVNGALTLGGTLDITDLGGFSNGVYRIIDYGGPLTDNGLAIGTLPPGVSAADMSIQTSVANQVNLVNTSGVRLQFWDGQGPPNDGIIQGGSGTWNATNTSWTDSTGTANATTASRFSIFESPSGTVTVDDSQGAVTATGMQFAADGYHLTGDPIALDGPAPVIRVGDGTAAGASFTATIDNVLSGSSGLIKADQGTLVLNGANTYSGGTLITRGTIRISSDANLGAATGALGFVTGTLETTASTTSSRAVGILKSATFVPDAGTTFELDGAISGPGALTMDGAGTVVIAGADTATGETLIAAGTLVLGSGGTTGSIASDVVDNGALTINRSDTVTLPGIISGTGSFAQIGTGTTIFAADNNYAGGTTIARGTLQLGIGGASGSLIGAVSDNGTLTIDRSDVFTFADAISGCGAFVQAGTGTTILTAENTYSSGTTIAQGTLQIGDGNVSGSIVGNVIDNSLIAFNRADTITFAGTISGTGGLAQIGSGTLILTGNDTYGGGTLITSGALQLGNDGTSGGILGPIVDNGKLIVDRSDSLTLDSAISGTGAFAQIGTGITTLTGASTYTGATSVGLGTLVVHGAISGTNNVRIGDFGNATLVIENGGSVNNTRSGIALLAGTTGTALVTGAGSSWATSGPLIIGGAGSGTLVLSNGGLATAGSVLIAQSAGAFGTLAIGALPGAAAQAPGTLDPPTVTFGAGTGALVFNHTDSVYVFDAPIAGHGTIEQDGPGTTILTADSSTFSGATAVNAGVLAVNGTLGNVASTLTVNSGGRFSGTGTIGGSAAINSGGILSPAGLPIGTLTVNGNLTFAPGAIYRVGLTPAAADLTAVGGTATLAGGVQIIAAPGVYPANATYPILTAAGGVNGTFDSQVTISSIFLTPTLSYSASEVDLGLAAEPFPDVATTPNQAAVAGAVESLGPSNPLFDAVFNLASDAEARRAFDALSGEVHASTAGVLIQDSRYVRDAVLTRLRGTPDTGPSDTVDIPMADPPSNVWMQDIAAVGGADSDGNAADLDRSIVGIIAGADTALDKTWHAGTAAAYTRSILHEDARASRAWSDDITLALYGSGHFDAFALRAGAAYTWHDVNTHRAVAFTGLAESDAAHYHAQDFQAFGEAGYTFIEGPMALEPFANIAYIKLDSGHFVERSGPAALTAPSQSLETILTTLGAHASGDVGDIEGAPVHLNMTLGLVHTFGDATPAMTSSFESGGIPFTIFGTPLARDSALVETGFDVDIAPDAKLAFLYSGLLAGQARDNSFKASLIWNF